MSELLHAGREGGDDGHPGTLQELRDRASRRIYLVGMSNGATMAGRFACEHPKRIAALAQVVGTAAADVAATRRPTVPVPIISIHATADRYAPYVGRRANDVLARLLAPADAGSTTGSGWT